MSFLFRNCLIFAATTCLIWDTFLNFSDECQYIWRTAVKMIYIFSRWFGITMQIINCVWVSSPTLSHSELQPETCQRWFGVQTLTLLTLLSALEIILALRVFALYNQNRKIGIFLAIILLGAFVVSLIFGVLTLRSLDFDGNCSAPSSPREVAYFSAVVISVHSLMWGLTVHKRNFGSHDTLTRVPIVRLVMRDGAWVFIVVCSMIMAITPYSFVINVEAHIIYPWPTTLMSIFICRLILNMQHLKTDNPNIEPELTSCIDLSSVNPF
ncbi:hypothetical protein BDZ94DRAFT_630965 [Collybia nuda]|uniref:DUF6533 domain-containing protein n=1 Tax=Collybia nuda TaxID=64659 RepID=A0A9P5Y5U1_9AGAR|nr:hypothetical protein BDZ94DRAFT_630965 [Collybia nuda]